MRTGVGANANTNATTTRYAYDALGRRISKSTQRDQQHNTTTFYWNGDVLLGEINEGVSNTSSVGNTKPSRTYLFEPFSFKPLALVQNGEVFHYHTDHIGTPREITNARAEVVWSSTFKTYGALAVAHVNEVDNPLRFQGQYHDEETGLHYNRHRYYDPNCGQFTTQDPIGLQGGMNAYQYAPNPMTWVDPWGLKGEEGTEISAIKSRGYDRPEIETKSGVAVKQKDATDRWDDFLGPDQTNIDPRDGLPDPDRIWSADGKRSIRFGDHEMSSKPNKMHYHQETWYEDRVENVLQRIPK